MPVLCHPQTRSTKYHSEKIRADVREAATGIGRVGSHKINRVGTGLNWRKKLWAIHH